MSYTVDVSASKSYKVEIGEDLLENTGKIVSSLKKPCKAAVITDKTVNSLYGDRVRNSLEGAGFQCETYAFNPGEQSKTMDTLSEILEFMAEKRLTRSDLVVTLGGGVPGDMGGFAAGVYMRGIPFVQMPTTLLAAVDSSVGGKTAVDLKAGKNLAGLFNQPISVICDTGTLKTLDSREFAGGMAETIKHGILADSSLFKKLDSAGSRESLEIDSVIARNVSIKSDYVNRDEFESGDRQFLNLGHTIGHAIEKCSGYTVPHGFAVAAGTAIIAKAAEKEGLTAEPVYEQICSVLKKYGLPVNTEFTAGELLSAAFSDKKRAGDTITLVIPEKIGVCTLKKVDMEYLGRIIRLGLE